MMKVSAAQINDILKGVIIGNPDTLVNAPAKIEDAKEGNIAFLANPKYESYLYTSQASIVIVADTFTPIKEIKATMIKVADPYTAFATLLQFYQKLQTQKPQGIEQPVWIDTSATLGQDIFIGAFTYIGKNVSIGNNVILHQQVYIGDHVLIGDNTVLHAGVKVYKDCRIGDNCIIHSNTVIGGDGFGFAPTMDKSFSKVPQLGNVIIGNNVEIGCNTCIDRATMGSTRIGDGVKLDNLIQIAHNVEVGTNTVIAAQTGVSGSTKIGKHCMIGGQVGIVGHIKIADHVKIQAQSGVNKSIKKIGTAVYGSPAMEYKDFMKSYVIFRNLPELEKQLLEIIKNYKS